nr:MAG TPA: hypothetical protein [Bacteriophage sp.]
MKNLIFLIKIIGQNKIEEKAIKPLPLSLDIMLP